MKIESITIDNIRSYEETTIDFDDGLLLIHGDNGSGKSSLLGSIFGGLYLSNVLDYMDSDLTLDTLVRRTETSGKISLTFSVGKDEYTVTWKISVSEDSDNDRTASTKECVLVGDEIDEPIEGVKSVDNAVQEIIGMGPESFINSVYVQQGDITRMVDADDEKRREIIDGLLGLSKLDTYIERMDEVRKEFGAQKRKNSDLLEEKERQLKKYDDEEEIQEKLDKLRTQKDEKSALKEKIVGKIDSKKEEITNIKSKIEKQEELLQQFESAKNKFESEKQTKEELEKKQKEEESVKKIHEKEQDTIRELIENKCDELGIDVDKSTIETTLEEYKEELADINLNITELENSDLRSVKENISQSEEMIDKYKENIDKKSSKKSDIEANISSIEKEYQQTTDELKDIESKIHKLKTDINNICERINLPTDSTPEEIRDSHIPDSRDRLLERAREVYEDLGAKSFEYEQYEMLIEDNVCPVCNETHSDLTDDIHSEFDGLETSLSEIKEKSEDMQKQKQLLDSLNQHVDSIIDLKSKKKRIADNLNQINQRLADKKEQKEEIVSEIQELEDSINQEKSDIQNAKSDKKQIQEKIDDAKSDKKQIQEKIDRLKTIMDKFQNIEDLDDKIEQKKSNIEQYKERKTEARNRLFDAENEKERLEEKLDNIEVQELENDLSDLKNKLSELKSLKKDASSIVEEKRNKIAQKEQSLSHVQDIKSRCHELEERKIDASEKEIESETIISTYKNIKKTLREENIGLLNKYANEIFQSVYHSKVFQHMEIDEDYSITLVTGDGVRIEPNELSGGEETIVSLSIRAGVYKLLVERNGSADKLPPFILDEPTTFLDGNHISNLQNVIDTIMEWDVPQVFIVSHKDNLIQNADSSYEISKNPVTETSTVDITSK